MICDDGGRDGRGQELGCGLGEEGKPAFEVVGVERELKVAHHGIAFVSAGGEQDRGPEVFEQGKVMGPVVDDGIEDGSYVAVDADFGVEAVYEGADLLLGDLPFCAHSDLFYFRFV